MTLNVTLLKQVQQMILADASHMDMDIVVAMVQGGSCRIAPTHDEDCDFDAGSETKVSEGFACGTVGCIAGHALLIDKFGPNYESWPHRRIQAFTYSWDSKAADVLGLPSDEANWLFHFHGAHEFGTSPYKRLTAKLKATIAGTPEYAAVVSDAIDHCIARVRAGLVYDCALPRGA